MTSNPLLDLLSGIGNVLDTPSSVARGLGSAAVRGIGGDYENAQRDLGRAFSGIMDPSQRVTGSEWTGDPWSGMAVDMATDPLNALGGIGLLKAARGAKVAEAANKAAMSKLTEVYVNAGKVPAWIKETMRPSYVKAMEAAAELPRRNPVLKMPLSEAAAKAKGMTRDDFVFGPAKVTAEDSPMATFYRKQAGEFAPADMPADLQEAWGVVASRYPKTTSRYNRIFEDTSGSSRYVHPSQLAKYGLPPGEGAIGMNRLAYGDPNVLLHELVHSSQDAIGKMRRLAKTPGVSQDVVNAALEPTAWRRNIEGEMASALFDYGNELQRVPRQSPLLAALAGHNVMARQNRMQ